MIYLSDERIWQRLSFVVYIIEIIDTSSHAIKQIKTHKLKNIDTNPNKWETTT